MIDRLKSQQENFYNEDTMWKILLEKWHEIKNPLTPIQLTIDKLKNKYAQQLTKIDEENFKDNLKIINNQIKQIENLVNDFLILQECLNQFLVKMI